MLSIHSSISKTPNLIGLPIRSMGLPKLGGTGLHGVGSGITDGLVGVGLGGGASSGLGDLLGGALFGGGTIGGILNGVVSIFDGQSSIEAFTKHATRYFGEIIPSLEAISDLSERFTEISKHNEYMRLFYTAHHKAANPKKNSFKGTKIGLDAINSWMSKFRTYMSNVGKKVKVSKTVERIAFPQEFISGMPFTGLKSGTYTKYVVSGSQADLDAVEKEKPLSSSSKDSMGKKGFGYWGLVIVGGIVAGVIYLIKKFR